jgi:hypothetical protein
MRVEDVSDGPAPIDVLLTADAEEKVKPYEGRDDLPEAQRSYEQDAIVSNTEGKIRSLELKMVLDEDQTTLKPGDRIMVNDHSQGT